LRLICHFVVIPAEAGIQFGHAKGRTGNLAKGRVEDLPVQGQADVS